MYYNRLRNVWQIRPFNWAELLGCWRFSGKSCSIYKLYLYFFLLVIIIDFCGHLNNHNQHIWTVENPQMVVKKPSHAHILIVWYSFWTWGIIVLYSFKTKLGQAVNEIFLDATYEQIKSHDGSVQKKKKTMHFFKNEVGSAVTVNGIPFCEMRMDFLHPETKDIDLFFIWFRKKTFLYNKLNGRIIQHLDDFIWSLLLFVYETKEIDQDQWPQLCLRVIENMNKLLRIEYWIHWQVLGQ